MVIEVRAAYDRVLGYYLEAGRVGPAEHSSQFLTRNSKRGLIITRTPNRLPLAACDQPQEWR
jgi:hypothetical protein